MGVAAIVLYIDGPFILTEQLLSMPISYFDYVMQLNIFQTDKDLYGNAVEACLAPDSLIYTYERKNGVFIAG